MASPLWLVELIKRSFPHVIMTARATRLPLVGRLVDRALFEDDDLVVVPTTRHLSIDRAVDPPEHQVLPSQVVEHFIRSTPHRWLMDRCICRDGSRCKEYPIDLGCLFLGEAALDINPDLGRRVTETEALDHLRRCRDHGLVHLVGRNKLDAVWLNVRPGQRLLTICSCCPCCCLWRIVPHVDDRIAAKVRPMPGVTVRIDPARCEGCGTCLDETCFVRAIQLTDSGRARITAACRGCGRCVERCPSEAIELRFDLDLSDSVGRVISRLSAAVDLS